MPKFKRAQKSRNHPKPRWYNSKAVKHIAKGSMSVAKMAAKAYVTSLALKKATNIEHKYHEVSFNNQYDWSGSIVALNSVAQGTTDSTREGDSIKMQDLQIKFYMFGVAATGPCQFRVIIIFDDMNKVSAASDVLETVGSALAPNSFKDWDKRFQTNVLYDQNYIFDQVSYATRQLDINIPIGKHAQFEASTTTINTGRLIALLISDQSASINAPVVKGYSRLVFTDN